MIPRRMNISTLATHLSMTEAQIEQMVQSREIPGPRGGMWNWEDVDIALTSISESEFVYFIEMGDFIKIGRSRGVQTRVRTLDKSLPLPTKLLHFMPGTCDMETDIHRKFKHLRTKGEWFRREPELVAFIDALVKNEAGPDAQ